MELWERSRALRIVGNIAFNIFLVLAGLISSNTLSNYTATGNAVLVVIFVLFAVWAWWYGEDRDRRSALNEPQRNPDADSG